LQQRLDKANANSRSRLDLRLDKGMPLGLPYVEAAHVLGYLSGMGWSLSSGMGQAPLTSTEVQAWCMGMQVDLDPWEFEAVLLASRSYCEQLASDDGREPNYEPDGDQPPISAVRALAAAFNRQGKGDRP
jgi:hypothetical protein